MFLPEEQACNFGEPSEKESKAVSDFGDHGTEEYFYVSFFVVDFGIDWRRLLGPQDLSERQSVQLL